MSTDQRIDLQNLNERREERSDRHRESVMVGLSIEEAALSNSIEKAEKRAETRGGEYNAANTFWKKVDALVEKHELVLQKISDFNSVSTLPSEGNNITLKTFDDNDDSTSTQVPSITSDLTMETRCTGNEEESSSTLNGSKKRVSKRSRK